MDNNTTGPKMENKQVERKVGAKGFYGEFPATIMEVCSWAPTMVVCRVPGGPICVPVCDIKERAW